MDAATLRRTLQHSLVEADRRAGGYAPADILTVLEDLTQKVAGEALLPDVDYPALHREIAHEVMIFGPLWRILFDASVSEVMVNAPDKVFAERNGKVGAEPVQFANANELRHTIDKIMTLDSSARLDQSKPWVDIALPDGSRANVTIPPIVVGGMHLTIRKYQGRFHGVDDLVATDTLDERMGELLVAATRARLNILFSGATGTGKTTLVEVLSRTIPHHERIICIEDTMEIHVDHPNVVRMVTRLANLEGKGEVTIGDLFRNSLRMCPDRVLLGEIRGAEAYDYLQALNSGHDGSLAVIHASSPEEALVRLQNLVPLAGLGVPSEVVRRQIAHGLDLVVQIHQHADGARRVTSISEVVGQDDEGLLKVEDLFRFEVERTGPVSVHGRFAATGRVPKFLSRLEASGMGVSEELFAQR
ncbi:MAG: CpaF family protein [Alphaproteobacteria bacterium]|nr:CpaF family protein [Alphaproteobacteria bacterium]